MRLPFLHGEFKFAHVLQENGGYCWDRLVLNSSETVCLFFELNDSNDDGKNLWDFMLLVWLSVTGKLLFWWSKQVRWNQAMRTRPQVLITLLTEIVDSNFYITNGLCENMDSQNAIYYYPNMYFEEEMWENLVEKSRHWCTALGQYMYFINALQNYVSIEIITYYRQYIHLLPRME